MPGPVQRLQLPLLRSPHRVQKKVSRLFQRRDIRVHEQAALCHIKLDKTENKHLESRKNQCLRLSFSSDKADTKVDYLFWCTEAAAPDWPRKSGLACDAEGFIQLNHALQSRSHPFVFAAGDIARQENYQSPRAGVFAVRQGPVLYKNLRAYCLQKPLARFKPQKHFLRLVSTGDKTAIACKPGTPLPSFHGTWVWEWKNSIDRRFMNRFNQLSPGTMENYEPGVVDPVISGQTPEEKHSLQPAAMRCGGCGAKVGADVLSRVIKRLKPVHRTDVELGLHTPDDASAIRIAPDHLLLQSVDIFRALVDDPFVLGEIAANHALSDLFAMNAEAHSALAIVTLPYAAEALVERDLLQVMSGALKVLNANRCELIGGHTSEGAEMSVGFSVNGIAKPADITRKNIPRPGDLLVLTQALGTGVLFAAHSQLYSDGDWISEAIAAMLQSNRGSADILHQHSLSACTDVTGFGLAGHLMEMLKPDSPEQTGPSARLNISALPVLPGALSCFEKGFESSLQIQNRRFQRAFSSEGELGESGGKYRLLRELLFDPQTSGGLLASIPRENSEACLKQLKDAGYSQASIIGEIIEPRDSPILLH